MLEIRNGRKVYYGKLYQFPIKIITIYKKEETADGTKFKRLRTSTLHSIERYYSAVYYFVHNIVLDKNADDYITQAMKLLVIAYETDMIWNDGMRY